MKAAVLSVALGWALAGSAPAQVIITNSADPIINGPGVVTVTFDTTPLGYYNPTLTVGAVTFGGTNGVLVDNTYLSQYNTTSNYLNNASQSNVWMTFTFATPMTAFGFNYGATDDPWTLSAYDAGSNLLASATVPPIGASNAGEFIGLATTNASIAFATFVDDGGIWFPDWIAIDNFKYTEVPWVTVSNPAPVVVISLGVPGVQLAWPASPPGFQLQSATNLVPPIHWHSVTNGPRTFNGTNFVALPFSPGDGPAFFQLVNPGGS